MGPANPHDNAILGRGSMAQIQVLKVEEGLEGRLLFSVRVAASAGRMELPIPVLTLGSAALNETAVLRSTLDFAEELAASVRLRLGP
jgi:hypothetical protein